jgi:hypothetical protein
VSAGEKFAMGIPCPGPGSLSKKYSAPVIFWVITETFCVKAVAIEKIINNRVNSLFISVIF